jgi:hypothetical protein
MEHHHALEQARQSLARLIEAERHYLAGSPYRLVHEHDMRGGRYLVRANVVHRVPPEILGEIEAVLRAARASLDAVATALAGVPTPFPVFETLPMFAQRARKALSRMPDEAQAGIEALQPYHEIGGFRRGALWILQQLAASRPHLAAGAVRAGAEMGVNTRRKVDLVGEPVVTEDAFDDGSVVASVQTRIVGPDPKLDMFLRAEFALAFDAKGPARGGEVVETLTGLVDHVGAVVLPALESSIPEGRAS